MLSSFCYHNWNKSFESNKIENGIDIENKLMKDLSVKFGCDFVDQNELIPKNKKHFVDSMHFTPNGMKCLVKNFSNIILSKKYV